MPQLFTNNARATLVTGIAAGDTTMTIEAGKADLFPPANVGTGSVPSTANWFKATLQDSVGNVEIVYVRSRSLGSGVFSNVIRGQEGTTARAFTSGTVVGLRITAADIEDSIGLTSSNNTWSGTNIFQQAIQANLTGNVTGNVNGNSATATALQTPRNIGGVAFDGSSNINLPGVNTAGNQNTSGNAATANSATTLLSGLWSVYESSGYLYFMYNGNNVMRLDTSGNLVAEGNLSGFQAV